MTSVRTFLLRSTRLTDGAPWGAASGPRDHWGGGGGIDSTGGKGVSYNEEAGGDGGKNLIPIMSHSPQNIGED